MFVLVGAPDLFYQEPFVGYRHREGFINTNAWQQTHSAPEATSLETALSGPPAVPEYILLLSVAIQYGKPGAGG